jgi:hypothetical protein
MIEPLRPKSAVRGHSVSPEQFERIVMRNDKRRKLKKCDAKDAARDIDKLLELISSLTSLNRALATEIQRHLDNASGTPFEAGGVIVRP